MVGCKASMSNVSLICSYVLTVNEILNIFLVALQTAGQELQIKMDSFALLQMDCLICIGTPSDDSRPVGLAVFPKVPRFMDLKEPHDRA